MASDSQPRSNREKKPETRIYGGKKAANKMSRGGIFFCKIELHKFLNCRVQDPSDIHILRGH